VNANEQFAAAHYTGEKLRIVIRGLWPHLPLVLGTANRAEIVGGQA